MSFSLLWLPDALESAGLKVAPVEGWQIRGRGEMGPVLGVMCHTTVGPRNGNMPSLTVLINGRSDLAGPLAQLGLGRDGTYYVIAAGRCNHAGKGDWRGIDTGNTNFIGIEAENTGRADDPWPDVQMDAYRRGVAAILRRANRTANDCVGHREYALPKGRKNDPAFDMVAFRSHVSSIIDGSVPPPILIPAQEPTNEGRPTLRRGARSDFVTDVQIKIGVTADGEFGSVTEAAVRALQRSRGLVPDGIVGPKTWRLLDSQ